MLGGTAWSGERVLEGKETLRRLGVTETCRPGRQSRCEEEDRQYSKHHLAFVDRVVNGVGSG